MSKDKFSIDMPDETIIEAQIDTIVKKGLNPKNSFYSDLKSMYKQIGFKYLFHDMLEITFTVLIIFSMLLVPVIISSEIHDKVNSRYIYAFIFTVSPIMYLVISLLSFVNTKQKGTYEIEMTCKYNIYQLATLRMLVFSVLCILFNSIFVYTINVIYEQIDFLRAFIVSSTSLFLFSTIFLYMIIITRSKLIKYIVITSWIVLNSLLVVFNIDFYIYLLIKIPIYVHLVVTAICIYVYINKLKKLITFRSVQGVI
ncbi:hypothetical protein CLPU_7c00310 [Gottschalkia purinilytica]|uniref:Uncharacterized protein n=1 Tax=Gottschalkia purinilytica TaxID=1503 RepID=A0A0L0WA22_GOTPU|nr:hypothetical protein [Gottschalkia purinilytica]KNF08403.1 hypothetical protein CLPU_7c00310 [Gottschalkia purinilytica]